MNLNGSEQTSNSGNGGITVLYVDTDKALADTYAEYFKSRGHRFHYIRDPRAISQNIKILNPDIILMEITFDHLNGDDVIRGLRKKGLTLPIVVLSKTVTRQLLLDMKQFGVDGFYLKPVIAEVLENRLATVIASKKNASQYKSGIPTVLIMTGNSNLNSSSYETFPLSVINEYGFNIMFTYNARDAVDALKSSKNSIRLILLDGNDPGYVTTNAQLIGIIQLKMKIPLYAIAETVEGEIGEALVSARVENIIDKSGPSGSSGMATLQNELLSIYETVTQRTARKRDKIIKDLAGISSLPPLPDIYLKIEALATDKNATVAQYGEILELDPSITARLLRMSNSALYSFKRKINSVKDAVALMGTREILSLVRLACITGNMRTSPEVETYTRDIWKHSSTSAIASREVYQHLGIFTEKNLEEELFISGIIHDIGKIVLARIFPEIFLTYMRETDPSILWNLPGEKAVMGVNHCEVGLRLAEHWKLPSQFRDVIAYHHDPSWNYESDLLKAIYLGDYIGHIISDDLSGGGEIDEEFLTVTGLSLEDIYAFTETYGDDIRQKADIVAHMITG